MAKGNGVKVQTLKDNLKAVTLINPPAQQPGAELYLCLYTTDPKGDDSGTEASYTGYARKQIIFGEPAMVLNVAEIRNTNFIEFPVVPANTGLSIGWAAIKTALTGGQLIYYGSLGASYDLNQGVKPTVPIGNLIVYED